MTDRLDLENGVPYVLVSRLGRGGWTVTVTEHDRRSLLFHLYTPDGRRLAVAAFTRHGPDVAHLDDIRLHNPSNKGRGMGTALLGTLLLALPKLGVQRVEGYTTPQDRSENPRLLGWYRRYGFRWNPEAFHSDRDVPMWWEAAGPAAGSVEHAT